MTIREKHLIAAGNRKIASFIKSMIVLSFTALLFLQQGVIFAQVISNGGAVISVTSGVVLSGKDIGNTTGTIENSGTINLTGNYTNSGTTNGNGAYNLAGDWTNSGIFTPGTSTVTFNGSSDQSISRAGGETFYRLTINKPSGNLNLANNVSVLDILNLTQGKIVLAANNLIILPATGSITGGSSASYIIADGTGFLKQNSGAGNIIFPIGGSASFLPLTLNNIGAPDNYSINLFSNVTENGLSGGAQVSDYIDYVKYTWRIVEDVAGGSDLSVSVQWNGASDEGAGFNRADCSLGYHNGAFWSPEAPSVAIGSGPYSKTRAGIAGGGSFAVGKRCTRVGDHLDPTITCVGNQNKNTNAGQCYYTVVGTEFNPTAISDNCAVSGVTNNFNGLSTLAGAQFPIGVTTVIWTVTDNHGRTKTCSYDVTVTDNQDPTITCPVNVVTTTSADATGNCTTTAVLGAPTTGDNCSVASVIAQVGGVTINPATYAFPIGVTTVNWIVTDGSGRTANCNQTVTVTDDENPTITCPANVVTTTSADATGNCTTTAVLGVPTTGDNCSVAGVIAQVGGVTINPATYAFPIGVTTVNWIVTDGSGRTANCNQTVTVTDDENPTITCPVNVVTTTSADATGNCTTTAVLGVPTTGDNCSVAGVIAQVGGVTINPATYAFPIGVTTVNWIVTDGSGRTANCNQTVTVTDDENPTITCPVNVVTTTSADATGNCTTTAVLGVPTTGDNCSVAGVIAQVGGVTINPATYAFPIGVTTVNWIVTDGSGRTASCNQMVTVTDDENPVITCPADITIDCEDDNTPTGTGTATATDNCAAAGNISITFSDVSTYNADPSNVLHYNYVITRTWRATDVAGNFSTCVQSVTVHDVTAPVITCPADITIDCEDDNTPTGTGTATATDNCAAAGNISITFSDVSTYNADPSNVLHYNYVITRTWRATDVAGNFSTCVQSVTVHDVTAPVITCPADITIDCEDDNTPTGTGTATATDNCAAAGNISITFSDVSTYNADPSNVLHYNYVITRTWRATDVAGNFSTCVQSVTVHDVTAPVITCPADITIDCEDDNTPTGTGTATATDNCAAAGNISITFSDVSTYNADPSNVLHYNYVITRTWRATDVAGNFSTCVQSVTVHDVTAPVITCPADITIDCEDDNTPTGTGTATATDNCAAAGNISITFSDVSTYNADPSNVLHYNYVITRTWRATDVAGNFSTCVQSVTVHDVTAPVITCPADITIDCEDDNTPTGTGTATATDNCAAAGNISITFSDVSTYNADPSNVLHYNYVITRTWRATDVAGNFSTCVQSVTVHDVTAPVITCPADITIDCEDDNTPTGTGTATATDNCAAAGNISITFSDVSTYNADPSNVLHYNYVITRTWRATDVAGNFSTCVQSVTVHDVTAPVITCPADITIDCEDDNTPTGTGTATATDNCAAAGNISITFSDVSTYNADPSNVLHYNYVITRTWRATDVAGNFSTCVQSVTVHDVTAPVITCPADITIDCEDDNTPTGTGTATATDNCAAAGNISITFSDVSTYNADPSNVLHYNYVITRTWRATDVAGNFSTCVQSVTVHDVTAPVITCPADITIDCEDDNTPTGTGTATATDNCAAAGNISITFSDVSTYNADPSNVLHYNYVITRTWRATDVAGNFSTCVQTITVHDVTNPAFTVPPTVTICRASDCTYNIDPTITGDVTDESDNCTPGTLLNATFTDDLSGLIDCNNSGFIIRTWTLTDIAGNTTVQDQTIWVEPTPTATIINNSPIVCDNSNVNLVFDSPTVSSNPANLSFEVKVTSTDPAHLGGTASGDFIITKAQMPYTLNGTLINTSDVPIQVTYTVNSKLLGCTEWVPVSETVWVNPTPQVVPGTLAQTICNDGTTSVTLGSPSTFTSGVITFNYTVSATGGVTGFTTPVTGLPKDHIIADVLNNPTDAPQTVTYTIIPVSPTGCADGPSQTVVVTINPTPRIFPVPPSTTQCDNTTTNILLQSPSIFTSGVIRFKYTAVASGAIGDVTGFTASATNLPLNHVIADLLVNHTDQPQTVTYTIIPVSPTGCADGPSQTVVVTINPTPRIFPIPPSTTQCDNTTTNILLQSPSTFTSGAIKFKYTAVASGAIGDVTGFTASATNLPLNHVIADLLVNHTDQPQTVTYTIIPVSPTGCADGPSQTVVVTINPTPRIFPVPPSTTQCDNTTTNILLQSPSIFTSGVIRFKYTAVASGAIGDVTGFTASATNLPLNHVIADLLVNHTDQPQTVTYTIIPVSPTGCADGPSQTVVVTINPTPRIFPVPPSTTQCDNTTTNILLQSPSIFTSGVIRFKYTAVASGAIGDVTGFTASATNLPLNHVIADLLVNHTDQPQTVTYTIIPVSPTGCADGPSQTVVVTINPTPRIFPIPPSTTQCDNTTTNILLQSPSTFTSGAIKFKYTAVASGAIGDVTGFTASATNLPLNHVIADLLVNHTDQPQTVTYTIIPVSPTGCADGPSQTVVVTINPTPRIFPVPPSTTQCDNTTTNILLQSPSIFTSGVIRFKYTAVASGAIGDVTGFTASATNLPLNHVIADLLVNHTDQPQTVTYTIIPVSPTGCADGPSQTVVVTINPTPRIFPVPPSTTQCDNTTTNILLQSPSIFTSGVIRFKYTAVASGAIGDVTGFTASATNLPLNHVIADLLVNHTDQPQTVTYTIIPVSPTGCADGPSQTVVVTINPTPRIFPVPPSTTQCDNTTTNILLQSPSIFTSGVIRFKYTAVASGAVGDVTGFTASASNLPLNHVIADLLVNHTDQPQTVTYTIIPVSPTGCADGPSQTVVVTINPTPRIFPVPPNTIQCDNTVTNILLQSPSTFTSGLITFKYTVTATGGVTGFTTPVSGLPNNHIIADNLINPTDAPQTVTYTIVPVSPAGCNDGPSKVITVIVNPTPRIFPVPPNTIQCDSTTTNIVLQSPSTFTSGLITFKFTATATGGVIGFTPSATGLPNGFIIADNLINPTDAPQTVTYTVVPVSPTGCNDGPSRVITIIVNPTPRIFPVPPNTIQCDNTVTNILLQSPSTFTIGLITFKYTVTATGGVTGFTTPVSGLPNNHIIADNLINPTDAPQTVTYTIVPVSPTGCNDGPSRVVTVIVNPTPRIFPVPPNTIQCDSTTTNIVLQSPSTFTSGLITFKFTATATGGVTGFTPSATGLPNGFVIADNLINPTDAPQTVTYTVVPVSPTGCNDGPSRVITVIVNPTPRIFPVPPNTIQCDNTVTNILLQSPSTFTSGVIKFKFTATATGGVTGFTASATNLPNGFIIADNLVNPTDAPQTVTYTVVPVSPTGCNDGPSKVITVTVNPTPRIFPVPPNTIQCDSTTTAILLQSPSTFTSGVIKFKFTATATGGVTGFTASATNLPNGFIIADNLINPTDAPQTVTYTVVPVSPTGCNDGPSKVIRVIVNPTPRIFPVPPNTIQCDSTTTNIVLQSPSTFTSGVIKFKFTATAPAGLTGYTASATNLPNGFIIADNLINSTDGPLTVTYTVVPVSPTGCNDGPSKVITVTVNPTPRIFPVPPNTIQCDNTVTNILLQSPSTFTSGVIRFKFTATATGGVTGFTASATNLPNGFIIADNLINPTDAPQTVTYTVVPVSPAGCNDGPSKVITVIVNPTPRIFPVPPNTIQCDSTTTNIVLQSPSTFTSGLITFKFTATATGGVIGFTPSATGLPNGFIIADNLINPTDAPQTVTYTVVPVSPTGCNDGPSRVITIIVNPTPRIFPVPPNTIQCDNTVTNILLQSPSTFTIGLITFKYTVTATGGVTGFTTPVSGLPNNHIIADNLINPTDAPQTVTYTIVPVSPTGCNDGPSRVVTVIVNPTPRIFPVPPNTIQCDSTTTNIVLQSPSTFTSGLITFKFTATATGGVTGFTPSATGLPNGFVIADNLINPTDAPQTVTYTVVPVSPTGCNDGPSRVITVIVNPTPRIFPVPPNTIQCDNTVTNILLQSPSTFTSGVIKFKFTATATGGVTGFTASATNLPNGFIIADNLVNPTDAPQTVTYTVVPVSPTGCNDGPSKVITVTVNPTPRIFPVPPNTIQCDSTTTAILLQSPSTFTSGVIKFKFTATATGGVTGFTASATNLPNGFIIADNLINPTDAPQTVTYTVVPVSPTGCNDGPSKVIRVIVNPTPRIFPVPPNTIQCDSTTTNIVLQSPSTFTSGVIKFKFTATAPAGLTGYTASATNLPNGFIIADNLINSTDGPLTVTYTVVPVSPTGCNDGPSKVITVTVNPTPRIFPVPPNTIQCDNTVTNILLQSPSTFTSGVIRFKFTATATGGVTGFTASATNLPNGFIIADNLINPTDAPQTVTYTVVPVSPAGCNDGPSKVITVIVNPTPRIFPVPPNTIQCDSTTTNIVLQSPSTFTSGLITFKYTVTTTGTVTGFTTPVGGLPNNQIIADKLINQTDAFRTVTYRIVPVSPTGCIDGPAKDIAVTVNPTPKVIPVNGNLKPDSSICFGTATQIVLTSPTVMTSGVMRFDYTVSVTGGPGVIIGSTAPETNRVPGYTIAFPYQNTSNTIQSVYYSITPKVDNAICVPGKTVVSEIKVHARPLQSIVVTKPLTCSGGAGLAGLRAVISSGANPYQIVWDGPVGYHKTDSLDIANLSSGKYIVKVTDNLGCFRKDSISIVPVTARAYISAVIIPPGNYNISCIGSTDGTILVSVTGGITPPYTYTVVKNDTETLYSGVFSGNLNLLNPTTYRYYNNLGAGSYTLIIRDVNSCEDRSRIVFRVPSPVIVGIDKSTYSGGYNVSCKGYNDGSAWVQTISGGRGGYTYRWYTFDGNIPGAVNTNRIDNVTAGTYFLEIKDVLGCITIASTVVTEPDGMQLTGYQLSEFADNNYNISCNGRSDGYINLTIAGGSGTYIYNWAGPDGFTATTKDIAGLKAGSYSCTVTDLNGCVLMPIPAFTLTEPPVLSITSTSSASNFGSFNINCNGGTGAIDITGLGGIAGTYNYTWTTTDGSGLISGQEDQNALTAGTYHLAITDLNGCSAETDITLTQPTAMVTVLNPTHITCQSAGFDNGSIDLTVSEGVGPYTYLWSNGATTEDISGLTEGKYKVTVTDLNGCNINDSVRVNLPASLEYTKTISDYNGFNISCNGLANGSIQINLTSGLAPFVYSWIGPDGFTATAKDISALKAGSYILLITDSNYCTATETITLTEPEILGMIIDLSASTSGGFNINCAGDSTGFIGIEPINQVGTVNYLWSDGVIGKTRINLPAGEYSVIITDANSCNASSAITLTEPDSMKLVFEISPPFCPDKPDGEIRLNITGGVSGTDYSYKWSDNTTNRNLSNIPAGFYKVIVTDLNECSISDSVYVEPVQETCLIIPNAISPNGDLINDVWNIGLIELYPEIEIKVFNRWGEIIWRSEKGYPQPWDGRSNGSSLPIDSYHYIIDLHNGSKPLVGNVTIVR